MFGTIKDILARAIFNRPPPVHIKPTPLINKIHESGWSDTSVDDWFYKDDVLEAVEALKESPFPITNLTINEIFGDLTKDSDDILQEQEEAEQCTVQK